MCYYFGLHRKEMGMQTKKNCSGKVFVMRKRKGLCEMKTGQIHILCKLMVIGWTMVSMMYFIQSNESSAAPHNESELSPIIEEEHKKVAYLTFDDGPSRNTIRILDILDEYGIKATFFVMANETPEGLVGYEEMIKRGHQIALHTYSHDYRDIYTSKEAFFENINQLEAFLSQRYNIKTNVIRFPGGSKNVSSRQYGGSQIMTDIKIECAKRGYRFFDWNVDSNDGISPYVSVGEITSNVLNGARNKEKAIILLHDINAMTNTVTALPNIIKGLKEQGFVFGIIDDKTEDMQF